MVERASNLSVPVGDLRIEVVAEGVQLLSFNVGEPGEFVLTIFDLQLKQKLSNMVYPYNVFVGMLVEFSSTAMFLNFMISILHDSIS